MGAGGASSRDKQVHQPPEGEGPEFSSLEPFFSGVKLVLWVWGEPQLPGGWSGAWCQRTAWGSVGPEGVPLGSGEAQGQMLSAIRRWSMREWLGGCVWTQIHSLLSCAHVVP